MGWYHALWIDIGTWEQVETDKTFFCHPSKGTSNTFSLILISALTYKENKSQS